MDRHEAITSIRKALRKRSGKSWSVRGDTGTAWGWITISAPPKRCDRFDCMTDEDRTELGKLLGLGRPAHRQGVNIAASDAHRREYVDRARGRAPSVTGGQYWD